jgi:hypothetical protein
MVAPCLLLDPRRSTSAVLELPVLTRQSATNVASATRFLNCLRLFWADSRLSVPDGPDSWRTTAPDPQAVRHERMLREPQRSPNDALAGPS